MTRPDSEGRGRDGSFRSCHTAKADGDLIGPDDIPFYLEQLLRRDQMLSCCPGMAKELFDVGTRQAALTVEVRLLAALVPQ